MKVFILILSLLLLVMQFKLWFGESSVRDVIELRETVEQQRSKNKEIQQRNLVLEAEVEDLKTGLDAIEARARNELGMIKKDETFIHIVDSNPKDSGEQ